MRQAGRGPSSRVSPGAGSERAAGSWGHVPTTGSRGPSRPWYRTSRVSTASALVQGNSNSIATVDISAGFVGLDAYMEIPAMFLTAFATYSGPVLWASHLVNFLTSEASR